MQYRIDASLDVANCMQLSSVLSTSADPADDVITERIELGIDHRLADLEAWQHVHVERRILPTEPHGPGLCDHRSRRSAELPAHPVLGPRLIECAEIVAAHRELSADQIFGGWLGLRGRKLDPALFMYVSGDPPIRPGRR